jgi:multiple sugar transport system permease protein
MVHRAVASIDSQARQERHFALALFAPAFVLLLVITTAPLVFLAWNSLQNFVQSD